ncbi:MAG: hypothetical protein Fur0035_03320 [Anaerolineales bacterium]
MRYLRRLPLDLTFLLGILLRVQHLFHLDAAREPFRLGGLFVAFSREILNNGFRLPQTIPFYSAGGIPFAYPPLAFYVEAVLLALFPRREILIANLLPPLMACLTLAAVFLLLKQIFPNNRGALLAGFFAYAFLPNAFANQIEAAGLAESFGSLALVIFFAAALRFRAAPGWQNSLGAGAALALCMLASPGSAIGAAGLSVLLGAEQLLRQRFAARALAQVALIAVSGAALSAPYWALVMKNHGRGIFLLPVLAQYEIGKQPFLSVLLNNLTAFQVTQDGWAFAWNWLIFLGLLWLILRGKPALPLAFLLLFSIPRENVWLMALPAALLFAYGLTEALAALIPPQAGRRALSAALMLLAAWGVLQSFNLVRALERDQQWKLSAAQVERLAEARALLPENAQILILGNEALSEWAPYLLQREVLNTQFGLEWQPNEMEAYISLSARLAAARSWEDIYAAAPHNGPLYVLADDKKRLTALSRASDFPFTLKLETTELQLGLLGNP